MAKAEGKRRENRPVVFGKETRFNGFLRFKDTLCIQGKFKGTIDATGTLIVDKDATVEADHIIVTAMTVSGSVTVGEIHADDKVDLTTGAEVRGDITAARLRIADGVLFDGQCSMTGADREEIDIFTHPTEEIKAALQGADAEDAVDER